MMKIQHWKIQLFICKIYFDTCNETMIEKHIIIWSGWKFNEYNKMFHVKVGLVYYMYIFPNRLFGIFSFKWSVSHIRKKANLNFVETENIWITTRSSNWIPSVAWEQKITGRMTVIQSNIHITYNKIPLWQFRYEIKPFPEANSIQFKVNLTPMPCYR